MAIQKKAAGHGWIVMVVCVLAVAVCVGLAFAFTRGRAYLPAGDEAVASGSTTHPTVMPQQTGSTPTVVPTEDTGTISVTAQTAVPEGLDVVRIVKQGYEMKRLMAIETFSSVSEISVHPLVQYAFCYLYAGDACLVDCQVEAMTYRQATAEEITAQIVSLFGSCPQDVTASTLYTSGTQSFEMWQPDYSRAVYAEASLQQGDGEDWRVEITYFEDEAKAEELDTATITVRQGKNGEFYLAAMI